MRTKKIFFLFAILFSLNVARAQDNIHKVSQQYDAAAINSVYAGGQSIVFTDDEFTVPNHKSLNPFAYVKLKVRSDLPPFKFAKTKLGLRIQPFLPDGTLDTEYTHELVVDYNPAENAANFIDLSYHQISNRYGVKIFIEYIKTDYADIPNTNMVLDNIVLELGFETERYYLLTEQFTEIQPSILHDVNESGQNVPVALKLQWDALAGAVSYDLEWTWVDNYGEPNGQTQTFLPRGAIRFSESDFEKNSTRIQTKNLNYEIPLIYAHGYLIYRVRGVGRFMDNTSKIFYGPWTSGLDPKTTVANWPGVVSITGHEQGKNWQFQSSYAEEGKKKEVVSYFDGSLRNRQTVTKVNTENNAIVGEVVYDNQGRAAIEILPVPLRNKNYIRFFKDLNKNENNQVYSHYDFDWDTDAVNCLVSTPKMSSASGSSKYYSSANDFTATNIGYVPNAFGYPFSQVEYMPDNTGRIKRKGGVGYAHQLNSDHETRYYYTNPEQSELNRLFGFAAGYAIHYKKNIVIDPNGQVSISYIDPMGKTIATALSGESPESLNPLDDAINNNLHSRIETDLLNNQIHNYFDTPQDNNILGSTNAFPNLADKLTFSKDIIVTGNNVPYKFSYNLKNATKFTPALCPDQYKVVYDVRLSLKDECAAEKFTAFGSETPGEYLNTYETGIVLNTAPVLFNTTLNKGAHKLIKELRVNEQALNDYADAYIAKFEDPNSNCYIQKEDFAVPQELLSNCATSCGECETAIGTLEEYIVKELIAHYNNFEFTTSNYTHFTGSGNIPQTEINGFVVEYTNHWNLLRQACDQLCYPTFTSTCSYNETTLLADLSPGGQYASTETNDNGEIVDVLSVFSSNSALYFNGTFTGNDWRNPQPPYADEQGIDSYVILEQDPENSGAYIPEVKLGANVIEETVNGETIFKIKPQDLKKVSDFIETYWQQSWAKSLLRFHPEYAYLQYSNELCKKTSGIEILSPTRINPYQYVTRYLSTDEYDSYLDQLDTYEAATNGGFANLSGINSKIFTADPYFKNENVITGFETSTIAALRNVTMGDAMANYEGHGNTMLQEAYKMVLCNAVTHCAGGFTFSSLTTQEEKDRVWNTYKSLYKSLKSKIKYVFINGYAINSGYFNGCIGSDAPTTVTNVLSAYPATMVTPIFNHVYGTAPASQLCGSETAINYQTKTKRFIPIDAGYNSAGTAENAVNELNAQNQYEAYIQTGSCPMLLDLELFMDDFFKRNPAVSNTDHAFSQSLTAELFKGFTGVSVPLPASPAPAIHTAYDSSAKTMTFTFPNVATTLTNSLLITLPSHTNYLADNLTWANYGTVWTINEFKNFFYDGDNSQLTDITALNFAFNAVASINYNGGRKEVVISGTTRAAIGECSLYSNNLLGQILNGDMATNDEMAGCTKKYKFREAFIKFLNQMKTTGKLFSETPVALSTVPAYNQTYLREFFEELSPTTSVWKYTANTFTITTAAGIVKLTMNCELPSVSGNIRSFEGMSWEIVPKNAFTLFYTDNTGQKQSITGSFNQEANFSCCASETNIVPTFSLMEQEDRKPPLDHLHTEFREFTPKDFSVAVGEEFVMEFSINKTVTGNSEIMSDWNPKLKINSRVFNQNDLYFYTGRAYSVAREHFDAAGTLGFARWGGTPYEIDYLEFSFNNGASGQKFNFENFNLNSQPIGPIGSTILNFRPTTSSMWNPEGTAIIVGNGKDAWWHPIGHTINFETPTELKFKAKMKFTAPLAYIEDTTSLGGGPPSYWGNVIQIDHEPSNPKLLYSLFVYGTNQTVNLCTACVPQPVVPVSCNEKYSIYLALVNSRFPNLSSEDIYNETEFCDRNLGYLVDSYKEYIELLNINSTEHVRYMPITQFGDTNLNYGYLKINEVIAAYKNYLSSILNIPVLPNDEPFRDELPVHVNWGEFVDQIYLVQNQGICPPAPMLYGSNPLENGETICAKINRNITETYQDAAYNTYLGELRKRFIEDYIKFAMEKVQEPFTMSYDDKEYQYTLYYYDQAGNLIQTVAPEGVNRKAPEDNLTTDGIRNGLQTQADTVSDLNELPIHGFKTEYKYNSLNQLVWQRTPDGGITKFAYDRLGRIIASQNAKQANLLRSTQRMSYTEYDALGRITEAGEVSFVSNQYSISREGRLFKAGDPNEIDMIMDNLGKSERTKTFYDDYVQIEEPSSEFPEGRFSSDLFITATGSQNFNSRNRVTGVLYYDDSTSAFNNGIFYNYDIHGNVKELVNYFNDLKFENSGDCETSEYANDCDTHIKRVVYDYDLISGNVKQVTYQPTVPGKRAKRDLFIHKYEYDADNRIVNVQTSENGLIWQKDANYKYYPHGPLSRVEIGDNKVQGIDYAYTLHGWLKTVNGENLTSSVNEMGNDGAVVNQDAFGYTLNYFKPYENQQGNTLPQSGDYAPINQATAPFPYSNSAASADQKNLYNGNISKMVTAIRADQSKLLPVLSNVYRYDQLNRIWRMDSHSINPTTNAATPSYNSNYSYDRNGNLQTLNRANETGTLMDILSYKYIDGTNKLSLVNDSGDPSADNNDLEDQVQQLLDLGIVYVPGQANTGNYIYDAIGQLTEDRSEGLSIKWRVDGKVSQVINSKTDKVIQFKYDGLGNRIAKENYKNEAGNLVLESKTIYSRDAQGNVMAVYNVVDKSSEFIVTLIENNIYGSSRLGLENKDRQIFVGKRLPTAATSMKTAQQKAAKTPEAVASVSTPRVTTLSTPINVSDFAYYSLLLNPETTAAWEQPGTNEILSEDFELQSKFKISPTAAVDAEQDVFIAKSSYNTQLNETQTYEVVKPIQYLTELSQHTNIAATPVGTTFLKKVDNTLPASMTVKSELGILANGYAQIKLDPGYSKTMEFGLSHTDDGNPQTVDYGIKTYGPTNNNNNGTVVYYVNGASVGYYDYSNEAGKDLFLRIERENNTVKFRLIRANTAYPHEVISNNAYVASYSDAGGTLFVEAYLPVSVGSNNTRFTNITVMNKETTNEVVTPINGFGNNYNELQKYRTTTTNAGAGPTYYTATQQAYFGALTANPSLTGDGYVERTLKADSNNLLDINGRGNFGLTFEAVDHPQVTPALKITYGFNPIKTGLDVHSLRFYVLTPDGTGITYHPGAGGAAYYAGDVARVERKNGKIYFKKISAGVMTIVGIVDLTPAQATQPMYLKYGQPGGTQIAEVHDVKIVNYLSQPNTAITATTGFELKATKTATGYIPKIKVTRGAYNFVTQGIVNKTSTYTLPATSEISSFDMAYKGMDVTFTKNATGVQFVLNNSIQSALPPTVTTTTTTQPAASLLGPGSFGICNLYYKFGSGTHTVSSNFDFTSSNTQNPIVSSGPSISVSGANGLLPQTPKGLGACLLDQDGDGIYDIYENVNGNALLSDDDTDSDGIPNYLDDDDDGDTVNTIYEILNTDRDFNPYTGPRLDTDGDGLQNHLDNDDDGDKVYTVYEVNNLTGGIDPTTVPMDTDNDSIPNYLDVDDDNDGYATWETTETVANDPDGNPFTDMMDTDNDGIPNHLDPDESIFPEVQPIAFANYFNTTGDKSYELSNHLGNVLVVVNDKKIPKFGNGTFLNYFNADILSYNDYYPFGSLMPGRKGSNQGYRYGFNGKEKDDELKGEGNSYDFGARMLDPRVGRWFAVDPLEEKAPEYSPYAYCFDNPIYLVDKDGLFPEPWVIKIFESKWGKANSIKFSSEIYAQMNKSWSQSFDKSNNSMERGATLTVNISKKAFEFVNVGGKGSTSGTFQPDINIDKSKNVLLGTFHTHPYGKNDAAWDGAFVPFSGGDFATMDDFDEAVSVVQSGKNVYVLAMTSKTPTNLDPAKSFYDGHFQTEYNKQTKAGLKPKDAAEKAGEFAVRKTAKKYDMMYFKGENGKSLVKQKL